MLAIYQSGVPPKPDGLFNLAQYVLAAGAKRPKACALSILAGPDAGNWSYGALQAAVQGTATGLRQMGLKPGDKLLFRLGNTVDFPIVYLGAIWAGIVPVPTSSQLLASEFSGLIDTVTPQAIALDPTLDIPRTDVPVVGLDRLRSCRQLAPSEPDMGDPDRLAYIVFTSGTSARPRAVMHAQRAILARQMMHRDWYGLQPDDRLMHAGAFNWTFTLGTGLLDPWSVGATALIPGADISPADFPALIQKHEVTIFASVPGIYRKMLKQDPAAMPTLRHGLSAGEKLPSETADAWRAATGREIYEAFGMSECSTFISSGPERSGGAATLGWPQAGRKVAILHDGEVVRRGQDGIIAIDRSDPGLMLGYLGDTPVADAAHSPWFQTGDRGRMGDDGQIIYLGRADDMLTAGGYRVSPTEVEAVLTAHPAIEDCAVVEWRPRPDVTLICAAYSAARPLGRDDLESHCEDRMASYKLPKVYCQVATLPRTANGKLSRAAVRDLIKAHHDQT